MRVLLFLLLIPGGWFAFGLASSTEHHRVLLEESEEITFTAGDMTTGRRSDPVDQLVCTVGKRAEKRPCSKYAIKTVQCENIGFTEGGRVNWGQCIPRDSSGRVVDVIQRDIDVSCEGWDDKDDEYILFGSCQLTIRVDVGASNTAARCITSTSANDGGTAKHALGVCFSPAGEIDSLEISSDGGKPALSVPFRLGLNVSSCRVVSPIDHNGVFVNGSSMTLRRVWGDCDRETGESTLYSVVTVTSFSVPANERAPAHERTSRAAVKVEAMLSATPSAPGGSDWASAAVTRFGFPDGRAHALWSADGKPPVSAAFDPLRPYTLPRVGGDGAQSSVSMPYGGEMATPLGLKGDIKAPGGLALPALTMLDFGEGFGLTVALSPDDKTVYNRLNVSTTGIHAFDRYEQRMPLAPAALNLTTLLFLHAPDWRPALAAVRDTWPEYVYPNASVETSSYDGLMAYADYRGEAGGGPTDDTWIPFDTLRAMGTRVNWDASFPFMGTPFVGEGGMDGDHRNWTTCYGHPESPVPSSGPRACRANSWNAMEGAYAELAAKAGVSTLAYGNMYMYGFHIQPFSTWHSPTVFSPACSPLPEDDLQRQNCTLNQAFGTRWRAAAMFDPATGEQMIYHYGLAVVDPGEPRWQARMASFYARQLLETPSIAGVALDEQQYLGMMNRARDDGVGWFGGKPAASLLRSFVAASAAIARRALHPSGRALLVNPHVTRLDMFRELDGILDEYGDYPAKMTTSGIAGLAMPVLAWNHCGGTIATQKTAASCATDNSTFDEFLGQHLYLGVQPMSPFVNQSHGVLASPAHLRMYEDWALLFKAIRGKQWFLSPHAVGVTGGSSAKANIFSVGGGGRLAVAVVAGGDRAAEVAVSVAPLRGVDWNDIGAEAIVPGAARSVSVGIVGTPGQSGTITTPMARGAVLIVLRLPSSHARRV